MQRSLSAFLACSCLILALAGCGDEESIVTIDSYVFGEAVLRVSTQFATGEPAPSTPFCLEVGSNVGCSHVPDAVSYTTDENGSWHETIMSDIQPDTVRSLEVRVWARPDPEVGQPASTAVSVTFNAWSARDTVDALIVIGRD